MNFSRCKQNRSDCFAFVDGYLCKALDRTYFKARQCPFYKTKEQRDRELKEHIEKPYYTIGGIENNDTGTA